MVCLELEKRTGGWSCLFGQTCHACPCTWSTLHLWLCHCSCLPWGKWTKHLYITTACYLPRGQQRKKSRTPRGEISWNQVEIMRNQSRFLWNQARKSAQPSSPTHFYNIWRHFWGKSRGNQTEIRKSRTPKLLVADPSLSAQFKFSGWLSTIVTHC